MDKITRAKKMLERMVSGKLYKGGVEAPEGKSKKWVKVFNEAPEEERAARTEYLRDTFGGMGKECYIEPPFYCDHGWNIFVGDYFYANTGFLVLDQCPVKIGNYVLIGPRVSILCATHPIDAYVRNLYLEGGKPVTIGDSVWIGGNVTINPGVTIGSNAVIGSGSVVTKDIPDGVVAAGNPCRVIRKITEEDHEYWIKELEEYESDMEEKVTQE